MHHVRTLMNNLDGMTEILWFSCGKRKKKKSRADLHSTVVVNYETNNKRSGKKDVRRLLEISCGYMFITLFLQNLWFDIHFNSSDMCPVLLKRVLPVE